jgi:hypothetical protein
MAKSLRCSTKAAPTPKRTKKLSLYPLDLETALGAALRAGLPPEKRQKKPQKIKL